MTRKNKVLTGILLSLYLLSFTQAAISWDDPEKGSISPNNSSVDVHDMAITHNRKGNEYLQSGYPLHAIYEYKLAIMLNPNSSMSASLYNNLGRSYEMIRQYDHAIASYQHAIKVNPDFSLYYKNLIEAYKAQKALDKACKDFEQATKANPSDAQAFYTLGLIYYEQKNFTAAQKAFKKFLLLEPKLDLANAANKYLEKMDKKK